MGYHMHQTGGSFTIRAGKIEDALNVLLDFDKGMNRVDESVPAMKQFAAIFKAWRWELEIDDKTGNVTGVSFIGEKLVDDDDLFRSIAKFVEAGSYIDLLGDDDYAWRWYFDGDDMVIREGSLVYEGEKPKVVIHVRGGVAEVASCPEAVEVEIIDYDDLEAAA